MSASMTTRFMRNAVVAGRQVSIYVATEIRHAGIKRAIDSVDQGRLNDTINRVADALTGNTLLSTIEASRVQKVVITSLDHESPADPETHSTVILEDLQGGFVGTGHVTKDTNKQQGAR
ncbi:hypothetical protein BKA66DRAFT_548538 [Pyrenochaeta sp. MPI-SDFR-AT-0127]|nr:hypothetical protein BKA66DRAFT_548538 [Pyrenochaeta sp. MPI-SDFR-AT-0127]